MLEDLAALAPQPSQLSECDGAYPPMAHPVRDISQKRAPGGAERLEFLRARIYVDDSLREDFLAGPAEFALRHELTEEAAALFSIDRTV